MIFKEWFFFIDNYIIIINCRVKYWIIDIFIKILNNYIFFLILIRLGIFFFVLYMMSDSDVMLCSDGWMVSVISFFMYVFFGFMLKI